MEVKLIVVTGKHAGMEIPLRGKKFLIGRGEECQLRLQSNMVSRKHCLLHFDRFPPTIEDCGSTNGTLLNQERITERKELKDADRISIGAFEFEVRLTAAVGKRLRPMASLGGDDVDVSDWLGPTDQMPPVGAPPAASPTASETMAGKSFEDTTAVPLPQKPEEEKTPAPTRAVGKPHRPPKPSTESSGEAAADMLRQFFHRKKP
jgi:pSer/pThr/pTyr-binding forkhead associated (FHA) protein